VTQHRIIVVETLPDVPVAAAQAHWAERHAPVYAPTPQLLGYVQNRPLEEEWERLGLRTICSETWFADRSAEQESFASDYYRESVMPDEARFLDRSSAWMGRFLEEPASPVGNARYRVLVFGADAIPGAEAEVLEVDRSPWAGGGPTVSSLWLNDRARALELARAAPSFAFAAEPAVVVAPPA
jgi:hypothetical protein